MKAGHRGGVGLWPRRSWTNVQKKWAGVPRDVWGGSVWKACGQTRNLTDSFPFLSPPLEPPAAPNPPGIHIPLLIYAAVLYFVPTQELLLLPPHSRWHTCLLPQSPNGIRKCPVPRDVHCNADTSPAPPLCVPIPSDLWVLLMIIQLRSLLCHLHGKALDPHISLSGTADFKISAGPLRG